MRCSDGRRPATRRPPCRCRSGPRPDGRPFRGPGSEVLRRSRSGRWFFRPAHRAGSRCRTPRLVHRPRVRPRRGDAGVRRSGRREDSAARRRRPVRGELRHAPAAGDGCRVRGERQLRWAQPAPAPAVRRDRSAASGPCRSASGVARPARRAPLGPTRGLERRARRFSCTPRPTAPSWRWSTTCHGSTAPARPFSPSSPGVPLAPASDSWRRSELGARRSSSGQGCSTINWSRWMTLLPQRSWTSGSQRSPVASANACSRRRAGTRSRCSSFRPPSPARNTEPLARRPPCCH